MRSGLPGLLQRAAGITALAGLVAGGVLAVSATPAAAAARGSSIEITSTSWSYVDSAAPGTSFANPAGNAPVGTQMDTSGVSHTTKSYYTFDISQFRGDDIMSASFSTLEQAVADCNAPTTPQAWLTTPADHATWQHQPAALSQLGGFASYDNCPTADVNWNVATEVQDALNAGRSTITIGLTLPDSQLTNPDNWRSYASAPDIFINYDRAPGTPVNVMVGNNTCTGKPFYVGKFDPFEGLLMSAQDTDPDADDWGTLQFVFWPKGHPDQSIEIDSANLPLDGVRTAISATTAQIADNTEYDLHVRANDGTMTSPWSPVCRFITELTSPSTPTVSSAQYPNNGTSEGGSGEPGTFVFNGGGSPNVVSFDYQLNGQSYTNIATDHNGNATLVYTPPKVGPYTMTVWSIDRAGNYSPQTNYSFFVADNEPNVSCTPTSAYLGVARQCTFSPRGTDVVGYVYNFNGGPSSPIAPGPDGTATVSVTPTAPLEFGQILNVQAKLANGNLTDTAPFRVQTNDGQPTVAPDSAETMVGVPAQFVVTPVLPGATSVTYSADGVVAATTVPVGPNGTATLIITPSQSGYYNLDVYTTGANGLQSGTTQENWVVDTNAPTVTSNDYLQNGESGGIGEPGTFVFSSPVAGVTSYTYVFDGGTPVTVPAAADGTASAVLTPPNSSWQTLSVTSTLANGTTSEAGEYDFGANLVPPTLSCPNSVTSGQQFTCALTATQKGATSFTYSWYGGPNTSVPATNGTATVTLTAPTTSSGTIYPGLLVTSATAAGFNSGSQLVNVAVNPASGG